MCGIMGTIPSTERNAFKRSLDTLYHRGPDDSGIELIGNEITLGHRRLSIIDLSSYGHQPMFDKSRRYSVVFNGEIYNFLEIRRELEKKGKNINYNYDDIINTNLVNPYVSKNEEPLNKEELLNFLNRSDLLSRMI